jgi:hypothetical protein
MHCAAALKVRRLGKNKGTPHPNIVHVYHTLTATPTFVV